MSKNEIRTAVVIEIRAGEGACVALEGDARLFGSDGEEGAVLFPQENKGEASGHTTGFTLVLEKVL